MTIVIMIRTKGIRSRRHPRQPRCHFVGGCVTAGLCSNRCNAEATSSPGRPAEAGQCASPCTSRLERAGSVLPTIQRTIASCSTASRCACIAWTPLPQASLTEHRHDGPARACRLSRMEQRPHPRRAAQASKDYSAIRRFIPLDGRAKRWSCSPSEPNWTRCDEDSVSQLVRHGDGADLRADQPQRGRREVIGNALSFKLP